MVSLSSENIFKNFLNKNKIQSITLLKKILKFNKVKKTENFYIYFLREFYKLKYWQSFEDFIWEKSKPLILHRASLTFTKCRVSIILKTLETLNASQIFPTILQRFQVKKYQLQDNFEYFFTVSNTYRNFFLQLSYNERFVNLYNKRHKFFYPLIRIQNIEKFSHIYKDSNLYKKYSESFIFFDMLLNNFFLTLLILLFENKSFSYQKYDYIKGENKQIFKSGGILANMYNDKRFFKKKNSPSFIYLYMVSFLNLLKSKLSKYNIEMHTKEIFLNLLLKNYNKMYSKPFKNVIKNFERLNRPKTENYPSLKEKSLNNFLLKNLEPLNITSTLKFERFFSTYLSIEGLNRLDIFFLLQHNKDKISRNLFSPIDQEMRSRLKTRNLLINKQVKQIQIYKNYIKTFNKFNKLFTKSLKKKKTKKILINYNLFDIMSFPHNGTRIKSIARK